MATPLCRVTCGSVSGVGRASPRPCSTCQRRSHPGVARASIAAFRCRFGSSVRRAWPGWSGSRVPGEPVGPGAAPRPHTPWVGSQTTAPLQGPGRPRGEIGVSCPQHRPPCVRASDARRHGHDGCQWLSALAAAEHAAHATQEFVHAAPPPPPPAPLSRFSRSPSRPPACRQCRASTAARRCASGHPVGGEHVLIWAGSGNHRATRRHHGGGRQLLTVSGQGVPDTAAVAC